MPKRKVDESTAEYPRHNSILLDTHVAVWLADGIDFDRKGRLAIEEAYEHGTLLVSTITAWEIGMLVSKGRLDLGCEPLLWFEKFARNFNASIIEMTAEIAIGSSFLPGAVHGDPADRILIATALAHSASIASADRNLLSYGRTGAVRVVPC